jgi:hypothetical protein
VGVLLPAGLPVANEEILIALRQTKIAQEATAIANAMRAKEGERGIGVAAKARGTSQQTCVYQAADKVHGPGTWFLLDSECSRNDRVGVLDPHSK